MCKSPLHGKKFPGSYQHVRRPPWTTEPSLQILALDNEARRLPRVQQHLDRLGLHAEVRCGDITVEDAGSVGQFEHILPYVLSYSVFTMAPLRE